MNEKLALKNLRELKEVFNEFGIKYWLDFGTLLGAVRDRKLIEWDHDIDLGMWDNDRGQVLFAISELEKRKFLVELGPYGNTIHLNRFGCYMDINLYHVDDDKAILNSFVIPMNIIPRGLVFLYHILSSDVAHNVRVQNKYKPIIKNLEHYLSLLRLKSKKLPFNIVQLMLKRSYVKMILVIIPKHYFEKLGSIKFYGMTFNVPSDVEDYLKYHYGEDWKKHKKEWEWLKDDGSVFARYVSLGQVKSWT